jgi:RNA polymerase sigma-70 factor (ECF subfamily)
MEERDAIARLKAGEIDALRLLVDAHALKARRTAYLITRDRDLAEDVTQDAFIRAYERIGSFDASRPFGPWFLRIVVRGAIDASRHGPAHADETLEVLDRIPDLGTGPEEAAEWSALRAEVWEAIGALPPKQRAVVVMRYYLDLNETEMARALGTAPGTVKSRLHTAREHLRQALRSRFFQEAHE